MTVSGKRGAGRIKAFSAADLRWNAATAVAAVLDGRSLSLAIPKASERVEPQQRPELWELCFGSLRWAVRLEAIVAKLMARPLKRRDLNIHALLLVGLYQLQYTRIPDHAAVAETVAAARAQGGRPWAGGLVNGVLREFLRRRDELLREIDLSPATRLSHPDWLIHRLRRDWPDDWERVATANNERPPMTLRFAADRTSRSDLIAAFLKEGIEVSPVEAAPCAVALERPRDVARIPGFASGTLSVQDAGAQLAAMLLGPRPGDRVLDACAAPGGKTGHLLEIGGNAIDLVAIDNDAKRMERVRENLQRLGRAASLVVADAACPSEWWDGRPFQRILLDAPCSASGVIRRHPDIKVLRRENDVDALSKQQGKLLSQVWEMLAPGGALLYSTCSVFREENENVVQHFLDRQANAGASALNVTWGRPAGNGRQILPGENNMDGFYYCLLRKRGSE